MVTKRISLELEAYNKLTAARRYPGESFSDVVLRAIWPEETVTAGGLLEICRKRGPLFDLETLERVERLKEVDEPPKNK
jgi:predicted CopG family antitoxin